MINNTYDLGFTKWGQLFNLVCNFINHIVLKSPKHIYMYVLEIIIFNRSYFIYDTWYTERMLKDVFTCSLKVYTPFL